MTKNPTPDERAARVAARHHGLITRAQARECGLTDRQVDGRVRSGRWERLHLGVYRIAGVPPSVEQACYAAVLAAGPTARASGPSALALLGVGSAPSPPTITVQPTASGRSSAALVRRSPLSRADCTSVGPIPCTSPGRALLEAAALVPESVLVELVDDAIHKGLVEPSMILGAVRRAALGHGRVGAIRLRSAVEPWLEGIQPGSAAEVRLIRRLGDWGLPAPVRQHRVERAGGSAAFLDLAWPADLVALEYDGLAFHSPRRLDEDVAREEELRALGWWVGHADRHDLRPSSTRLRDELLPRLRLLAS